MYWRRPDRKAGVHPKVRGAWSSGPSGKLVKYPITVFSWSCVHALPAKDPFYVFEHRSLTHEYDSQPTPSDDNRPTIWFRPALFVSCLYSVESNSNIKGDK
ncbi:hypothetical protein EVAR_76350_1 [Eumeta japonica]|uniref:Uncharacterized protein n=1 Tax=Eumeta variegata TaxID=151549 RepID=A0A4C1TB11_EUMVA|nr:hypothetical protein EVAR_76350_1 [Eumeta japonica]